MDAVYRNRYKRKKTAVYLLPQHREFAITLWKHAEINAISISIILGYFLFHKIAGTIALALVLYAVELLIMNKKLLPSLHRAGGKHITWRKEHRDKESGGIFPALLFLFIGIGLFLCLVFQQTVNTIETITAAAGGCIAVLMGVRTLYQAKTTGK